ncbi:MAG: tRNA (adenosine(37)-N6)-threonylcarbamoyltransferase complex transferase subunit TsaD [Gemmatimonadetes bacterium]|nr:tRNA (adenosine(37)-N6)-threonylcarbamoyltransferase complex transferase subunit TsaD [Gemmatimonadota bacterium]
MVDTLLAIETSCDETSAAVLKRDGSVPVLSSLVVLSQDVHEVFGGVVPELASRAHLQTLDPVVAKALEAAHTDLDEIDSIAVTAGPGLVGSLLVGVCYAKALAAAGEKKMIGVNHLEGHVFAPLIGDPELAPPFVALLVSGGHTMLLDVPKWGHYRMLGQTRDDAAGEAFDKVAAILDLGYPGGPAVEKLAEKGEDRFHFPRPMLSEGFDFSFSGLKTAVLYAARDSDDLDRDRADIACSFQCAAIDVLVSKAIRAVKETGRETLIISGGVACNETLALAAKDRLGNLARVSVAPARLNTDNAAVIGRAGWFRLEEGTGSDAFLEADPRMPWPGLENA